MTAVLYRGRKPHLTFTNGYQSQDQSLMISQFLTASVYEYTKIAKYHKAFFAQ